MPKHPSKLKDIVARSITLKDTKGKTRIYMGVTGEPPHSSICLFGDRERSIEISADPEGGLHASFRDGSGKIVAGLGISSDDRVGLYLHDHRTGTRTELGSDSDDGSHQITLHHQGKIRWTTKKKLRPKKTAQPSAKTNRRASAGSMLSALGSMTTDAQVKDAALEYMATVNGYWRKVAMVYAKVTEALGSEFPEGEARHELFDRCIEALVHDGRLVAKGDIKQWRFSEVRLP